MRLGSLCSGYGGLETGISQVLDIEPVWCSEIDKDASKVLATHHPSMPPSLCRRLTITGLSTGLPVWLTVLPLWVTI